MSLQPREVVMPPEQALGSHQFYEDIVNCLQEVYDLLPEVRTHAATVPRINELSGLRDLAQRKPPTPEEAAQIEAWTTEIETLHAPFRTPWRKVQALVGRVAQLMNAVPLHPAQLRDLRAEVERLPLLAWGRSSLPSIQRACDDLPVLRARLNQFVGCLSPAPGVGLAVAGKRVTRSRRDATDKHDKLQELKLLVREIYAELTRSGPCRDLHKKICERLANHMRPPGARWARYPWPVALVKHPKAVRKLLSTTIHEPASVT
jgi:hypothetical protein